MGAEFNLPGITYYNIFVPGQYESRQTWLNAYDHVSCLIWDKNAGQDYTMFTNGQLLIENYKPNCMVESK